MSRPGYWRTRDGVEKPITELEDSHVRNILRLTYRLMNRNSGSVKTYWENKFCELGEEAQRRGIIRGGDITMNELETIVAEWQAAWDRVHPAPVIVAAPEALPTIISNTNGTTLTPYSNYVPSVMTTSSTGNFYTEKLREEIARNHLSKERKKYKQFSGKVDVFAEIARITGRPLKEYTRPAQNDMPERRLDLDL